MTARRRGAGLAAMLLMAACGARSGIYVGDDGAEHAGVGGASAGRGGAGAPSRAGAPNAGAPNAGAPNAGAPNAGAPNAGAPNAGAPNAGAPNAGAAGAPPIVCTPNDDTCPNGFKCDAGQCLTHCDSAAQCRADRFCASGEACSLRATQIAAGKSDTCVVLSDGSMRCWGDGDAGQLGDGLATSSSTPVTVKTPLGGDAGIQQLALGTAFACAVTGSGIGSCWGAGDLGQLGNGTLNPTTFAVPIERDNPSLRFVAIGAGRYHACALMAGGEVRCWGANFDGQLGNGTTMSLVAPFPIDAFIDPTTSRVRSGEEHTCILLGVPQNGAQRVTCWGDNSEDQLGFDGPMSSTTPVNVENVAVPNATIIDIAAGAYHTCAVYTDGSVRCWGDNSQRQLGVAAPSHTFQPQLVQGVPAGELITSISAGERHTCALTNNRNVYCWGNGLASGAAVMSTGPVRVLGLSGETVPVAIAAGATHTCALMLDGSARCWGSNNVGALGVPDLEYSATAVAVRAW